MANCRLVSNQTAQRIIYVSGGQRNRGTAKTQLSEQPQRRGENPSEPSGPA